MPNRFQLISRQEVDQLRNFDFHKIPSLFWGFFRSDQITTIKKRNHKRNWTELEAKMAARQHVVATGQEIWCGCIRHTIRPCIRVFSCYTTLNAAMLLYSIAFSPCSVHLLFCPAYLLFIVSFVPCRVALRSWRNAISLQCTQALKATWLHLTQWTW